MLFPYRYVPHRMEKLQSFIDFIFHEVWCKAPSGGAFQFALFNREPELKTLMETLYYSDKKGGDFFYGHVERIYGLFAQLMPSQIHQFTQWYAANNDIEKVCANDPSLQVARYRDIQSLHPELCDQLASFFKGIYGLLDLQAFKNVVGEIGEHYKAFIIINNTGKCPFCGIADLMGQHHGKREAYDHYLPKALYPFNSINFHNLAPACHTCNSTYKGSKDPVHHRNKRRKAFYPYSITLSSVQLSIEIPKPDFDHLAKSDIQIHFGPSEIAEEIETWKTMYGIEERYRGKLLDGSGKAWQTEVLDEWRWKEESAGAEGRAPEEYLKTLRRHATKSPFNDTNFLKLACLEACEKTGIFNRLPPMKAPQ